jgi:hypothetical protein
VPGAATLVAAADRPAFARSQQLVNAWSAHARTWIVDIASELFNDSEPPEAVIGAAAERPRVNLIQMQAGRLTSYRCRSEMVRH